MKWIHRVFPLLRWLSIAFSLLASAFGIYTLRGAERLNPWVDFEAFANGEIFRRGGYVYFVAFSRGAIEMLVLAVTAATVMLLASSLLGRGAQPMKGR